MKNFAITLIHADNQDNPVYQDITIQAVDLNSAVKIAEKEYPEAIGLLF